MVAESTFHRCPLYAQSLGQQSDDQDATPRSRLRVTLDTMRSNSALIAAEIARSAPHLTVHDISHSDALWDMADEICSPEISLTPLEAFVFGAAVLVHDLGLSPVEVVAPDKRMEEERCDLVALKLRKELGRAPSQSELCDPPASVVQSVDSQLLRERHAQRAESLATEGLMTSSGDIVHIIPDDELRIRLGRLIGSLAHSHYWSVDNLPSNFDQRPLSLPGFPKSWVVDRLKLACLLRLADAAQLDIRRAPVFLNAIRRPEDASANHWDFQERLERPTRVGSRLSYPCIRPFEKTASHSWWLAYDCLREVDGEFRRVDSLLYDLGGSMFPVAGVAGVETPERFCQNVPTDGWVPLDAKLRVGDVPRLVRQIGGQALYGRHPYVAVRELVQNGIDAVVARSQIDTGFSGGRVVIHLVQQHDDWHIVVEDDGLGMSQQVLTDTLLDFGSSLWRSDDARSEHPGLLQQQWEPIGNYGIGFYSVFLLGDEVRVRTNKYDNGANDTSILEFDHGVVTRPLLRDASREERLVHGGTVVSVKLRHDPYDDEEGLFGGTSLGDFLDDLCRTLFPAVDVSLYVCDHSERQDSPPKDITLGTQECDIVQLLEGGDWKTLSSEELFERLYMDAYMYDGSSGVASLALERFKMLERPLFAGSEMIGRLAVATTQHQEATYLHRTSDAVTCVGGIRADTKVGFSGIVFGRPGRASRDEASVSAADDELTRWANEQFALLPNVSGIKKKDMMQVGESLRALGAQSDSFPLALGPQDLITPSQIAAMAVDQRVLNLVDDSKIRWFETADGSVEIRNIQTGERLIPLSNTVFADSSGWSHLLELSTGQGNLRPSYDGYSRDVRYPKKEYGWRRYWYLICDSAAGDLLREVANVWQDLPEQIVARGQFDAENYFDPAPQIVGHWESGESAMLPALILRRDEIGTEVISV